MRMYYVAICDSQKEEVQYLKRLIKSNVCEKEIIFYEYFSGEALISDLENRKTYDLLILDSQLEDMDGNETARAFRKRFPSTLLVFYSGGYHPTPESFEVLPYRYLLKSYTEERMKKEMDAIGKQMKQNYLSSYVVGKKDNSYVKVKLKDIWYIELARRKSVYHCNLDKNEEMYTSAVKLEELYERLKDSDFVYAHNSYLVNLQHVAMAGRKELELDNGMKLTVARSKAKEFQRLFVNKYYR